MLYSSTEAKDPPCDSSDTGQSSPCSSRVEMGLEKGGLFEMQSEQLSRPGDIEHMAGAKSLQATKVISCRHVNDISRKDNARRRAV